MIRYDNGAVVSIEAAFSLNIKEDEGKIQLFGTRAGAKLDPSLEMYTELNGYMSNVTLDTETALDFDGLFEGEIDHYVDCIRGRADRCISPAEDGITLMKILDGIYESAATGHEVLAVLGVGVDDVGGEGLGGLRRVVAHHHHEVRRVKVDRNPAGTEAVEESPQAGSRFRPGLDREMGVHRVGDIRQLPAGLLHDRVPGMVYIRRDDADMGRDDVGLQVAGEVQNPLGPLDQFRVFLPVAKPHPEVAAEGRDGHPGVLNPPEQLPPGGRRQILGRHLAFGGVDLHPFRAQLPGLFNRFPDGQAERVQHHADLKIFHLYPSFQPPGCPRAGGFGYFILEWSLRGMDPSGTAAVGSFGNTATRRLAKGSAPSFILASNCKAIRPALLCKAEPS